MARHSKDISLPDAMRLLHVFRIHIENDLSFIFHLHFNDCVNIEIYRSIESFDNHSCQWCRKKGEANRDKTPEKMSMQLIQSF